MPLLRMTAQDLYQRLQADPPPILIDLRHKDDVQECRIDAPPSLVLHIHFEQFLDGVEEAFAELPRDRQLILLCGRGRSAMVVAMILEDRGYDDVAFVAGGMIGWKQENLPVITTSSGEVT